MISPYFFELTGMSGRSPNSESDRAWHDVHGVECSSRSWPKFLTVWTNSPSENWRTWEHGGKKERENELRGQRKRRTCIVDLDSAAHRERRQRSAETHVPRGVRVLARARMMRKARDRPSLLPFQCQAYLEGGGVSSCTHRPPYVNFANERWMLQYHKASSNVLSHVLPYPVSRGQYLVPRSLPVLRHARELALAPYPHPTLRIPLPS